MTHGAYLDNIYARTGKGGIQSGEKEMMNTFAFLLGFLSNLHECDLITGAPRGSIENPSNDSRCERVSRFHVNKYSGALG